MRFMLSNIHKRRVLYSEIISLCCDEAVNELNEIIIELKKTMGQLNFNLLVDDLEAITKRLKGE